MKERQKSAILGMAAATLIGMPVIGWIIARFSDEVDLMIRWTGIASVSKQLMIGIPYGLLVALIARFIVSRKFMEGVRMRYAKMLGDLELNWSEIIFISLCAGVGEELLFRGAMQPLLGIYLTAFIFVAIHGYLNPRDWRISVYGLFMTVAVIGFGYLTEIYGIWTAVAAHTIVDVVLLADYRNNGPNEAEGMPLPEEPLT